MLKWEYIDENLNRLKVPGGWLVKCSSDVYTHRYEGCPELGFEWRESIAFVPDPNYEWVIENE